jgi:hypothetical protein
MKAALLILMVMASVAMAGDAKIKAMIVGTWTDDCTRKTYVLKSDGTWTGNGDDLGKWDVQKSEFINAKGWPFTILFLTKHECLMQSDGHGDGYVFWMR